MWTGPSERFEHADRVEVVHRSFPLGGGFPADRTVGVREGLHADLALARTAALSSRPADGKVQAAERGAGKPAMPISHPGLAGFLSDTVEKDAWIRHAPLVCSSRG